MGGGLLKKIATRSKGDRERVMPMEKENSWKGAGFLAGRAGDLNFYGILQLIFRKSRQTAICMLVVVAVMAFAAGRPQDAAASEPSAEPVYRVVSPIGDRTVKVAVMAPRLDTLAGKTVCMVWNHAFKADVTLPAIGETLKKQYPSVKIVPYQDMPVAPLPEPQGAPRKEYETLQSALKARGCNAVISGNGG